MRGLRRTLLAVALVAASFGSTLAVSLLSAQPGAALATCTDNWQGATSGTQSWATPANWSTGVPVSTSVVCIALNGTYTVDLTAGDSINTLELGGTSGTQTLEVSGASGNDALSMAASTASLVGSQGVLSLDPTASGYAAVEAPTTALLTVASGGTLSSAAASGSSPAYIESPVTNQSGGTVTIGAPTTDQDEGTLTTNDGTFTVASGGKLALTNSSSFTDAAGSLTVTGTMTETSGTFTQSGATESGQAVVLSGTTLADSAGTGGFDVTGSGTLSGTIPSGQTVTVNGASGNVALSLPAAVTDDGTLSLTPGTGYADVSGNGGLSIASGGTLSSAAATGSAPAYIETPTTNQSGGTVTLGAPTTDQDEGTLTTNDGSFTVASSGKLALTNSSSFTDAAGTLVLTGTMTEASGTFTQSGANESGQPVVLSGTTLADSAGTGGFNVTGSGTLSGTIPSGQTVTVNGASGNVVLSIPSAVTDDGTLALTPATGYAQISSGGGVTIAAGGVLSTTAAAGSSPAYVETPVTNQSGGSVTVGAPDTRQDEGTLTSNAGTFQVVNGGHLTMSDGSTLTTGAGATLGLTVNGTSGSGGIGGPGLSLAGTLAVTTVGSPSLGTIFTPITGPVSGTFSGFAFGPKAYTVAYPSNAVQLTTVAPFTMSPTSFSPKENVATGAVELATIGNATAGTGSYSATVNGGDATATQAATVAITGASGTVTGPTHTYTTPGNYTVTTTLANSDGTTLSTTESVTVTGPTITKFSKTSVKQGKKLTTVVSGTGFTAGAVVTTSNPGITVVSAKLAKVTKKHPVPTLTLKLKASKTAALGPFNVTLSESSGTVTATGAITVLAK